MARLLIAVLAVTTTSAFKTPKRALKVRGGVDIQKVGTALIGLEGIVGMIAPETACKNYGHTPSPDDVQFKRYTSSWLAALAMLLSSDASSWTSSFFCFPPRGIPISCQLFAIASRVSAVAFDSGWMPLSVHRLTSSRIAPSKR